MLPALLSCRKETGEEGSCEDFPEVDSVHEQNERDGGPVKMLHFFICSGMTRMEECAKTLKPFFKFSPFLCSLFVARFLLTAAALDSLFGNDQKSMVMSWIAFVTSGTFCQKGDCLQ